VRPISQRYQEFVPKTYKVSDGPRIKFVLKMYKVFDVLYGGPCGPHDLTTVEFAVFAYEGYRCVVV